MNKKGFTLIELIGAIIILGIIALIAYATYNSSLRGFRDDYYVELERTLEKSGQEFFNDNRNYRPQTMLGGTKVSIETLKSKGFLDEVKDYNGEKCGKDSYVLVVKEGKDNYSYHTCLVCQEDDYDNRQDKYCDLAWLDSSNVEYGLGTIEPIYVYKGTPRGELRDLLEVSISYIKRNSKGEIIGEVRGTGYDDVPTILPNNIDIVDTNKVGEYILNYEYNGETAQGKVIVYENNAPNFDIKFKSEVAGNLSGTKIQETGNYVSGEWKQRIFVKISQNGTIIEPGVGVSRFQWNKDGRWQDLCIIQDTGVCLPQGAYLKNATDGDMNGYFEIVNDMNETIEFRMIATNGKISKVTTPIVIRRDNTDPTCELTTSGKYGDNAWYISDVNVTFKNKYDVKNVVNDDKAVSGEKVSNITISTGGLSRTVPNTLQTHSTDTTSVEYRGYIEDQAGNFYICKTTFKRDTVDPVCELSQSGNMGDNNWYVGNVGVTFKTNTDATSGVFQYGISTLTGARSLTHDQDTGSVTYTGHIKDYAGHTSTCTTTFKKDATKPTCVLQKTGAIGDNSWHIEDVKLSFKTTTDNLSGVATYGINGLSGSKTITHSQDTSGITYTGHIKDNAGNTNTCDISFKRDATKPSCELQISGTAGEENWYRSDVKIEFKSNTDNLSGVYQYGIGNYTGGVTKTHSTDTSTSGVTYEGYIKDYAGNTNKCSTSFKRDTVKPSCTLKVTSGTLGTNDWYKSSTVTVGFGSQTDALSGVYSYGVDGYTSKTSTLSKNTTGTSYTGKVKDKAGNEATCSLTVKKDDASGITCTTTGGNTTWKNSGSVPYGARVTSQPISGCIAYDDGFYSYNSNCSADLSYPAPANGAVQTTSHNMGFVTNSGALIECGKLTWNIYLDTKAPSCGIPSGSNSSTSGVTATISCSDDDSGCVKSSYNSGNVKTGGSLTIKDNAGNTANCPYSVYKQSQKRTASCNTCKRCDSATCQTYKECQNSACGQEDYNCSSCYTGSKGGCTGGLVDKEIPFNGTSSDCYAKGGVVDTKNKKCKTTEWDDCKTETPNTCKYGCDSRDKSCRTSGCGCETRNQSCPSCGCSSWGNYGGWSDVSSCSSGENSSHDITTDCQTVYRVK